MRKKAQVWIEVVIYTLIGLAIIGILLSIINPIIEDAKDRIIIQQSLDMLNEIKNAIDDVVYYGAGNSRSIEFAIKKGKLAIYSKEDRIEFSMASKHKYSELGQKIQTGRITTLTEERGKNFEVFLSLDYGDMNLTWSNQEITKEFQESSLAYKITATNKGKVGRTNIDFAE